jgi:hypothetical protein
LPSRALLPQTKSGPAGKPDLQREAMKAIHQLIGYFEAKRQLTRQHIKELVAKGYWGQYTAQDIRQLETKIGESFVFEATGNVRGQLWGTDIYTSDSDLGAACVHAGILQPGETGVAKVTMVAPIPVFTGTTRNGMTSATWTPGWSGAYTIAPANG